MKNEITMDCPSCHKPMVGNEIKISRNTGQLVHIPKSGQCFGVI